MVAMDDRPDAGGNFDQPDDGRDENGRLPQPLDAAHWPPSADGPAIVLPGQPLSQPHAELVVPEPEPTVPTEKVADAPPEPADTVPDAPQPGGLTTKNTPVRGRRSTA